MISARRCCALTQVSGWDCSNYKNKKSSVWGLSLPCAHQCVMAGITVAGRVRSGFQDPARWLRPGILCRSPWTSAVKGKAFRARLLGYGEGCLYFIRCSWEYWTHGQVQESKLDAWLQPVWVQSNYCSCHYTVPGLAGRHPRWPVKPESIFSLQSRCGLGVGEGRYSPVSQFLRVALWPPLESKRCGQQWPAPLMQGMGIPCRSLPVFGSLQCYLPVSLGFSQPTCSSYHSYMCAENDCQLCHFNELQHATKIPNKHFFKESRISFFKITETFQNIGSHTGHTPPSVWK